MPTKNRIGEETKRGVIGTVAALALQGIGMTATTPLLDSTVKNSFRLFDN